MFRKHRNQIAILPLENALLFPNTVLPMQIYERDYFEMIDYSMETTKKLAITLRKPGVETEPEPGTICCIGNVTYAETELLEDGEGRAIIVSGTQRARIVKTIQTEPFIIAKVKKETDTCSSQTTFRQCRRDLPKLLMRYLFLKDVSERDIHLANLITDPGHIADFFAYYFVEDMYMKMEFLEMTDVCERCLRTREMLTNSIRTLSSGQPAAG